MNHVEEIYEVKNICCIGAGFVGGPTSAVIADCCSSIKVTVVDKCASKISAWLSDDLPIFEPGLSEMIQRCRQNNLFFSIDIERSINEADLIFICVDTPTSCFGPGSGKAADVSNLQNVARIISNVAKESKIVVEKSTVPVKAAESIKEILSSSPHAINRHHIVMSNPEFLAEGSALNDLLNPDRVLIGVDETCCSGNRALKSLKWIYSHWVPSERLIVMSTWSAELSKLAANAFLAQRVSSINSLTSICESTGADIRQVSDAIGRDQRIGPHFLNASFGFGGSCFRKDILNLIYLSDSLQLPQVASYWQAVVDLNDFQTTRLINRIFHGLLDDIQGKKISIWGFAFKQNTHDTRESPAIKICQFLLEHGAFLSIFDPKVPSDQIIGDLKISSKSNVEICLNELETVKQSCAIIICTEWDQFKVVDFHQVYSLMKHPPYIFDGRLILDHKQLKETGFIVDAVGINVDTQTHTGPKQCCNCDLSDTY